MGPRSEGITDPRARETARRPVGDGWVWCGYAGHFVGAKSCQFHLHTRVGNYRVSTVGDYHPGGREEMETLGAGDCFYETFVFRVEGMGTHGEGDVVDWSEVEVDRYRTSDEACAGHLAFCWVFDARTRDEMDDEVLA